MLLNLSFLLFLLTLMSGTLISISSSSWLGAWMGLEMNLLSFIPLMSKSKNPYESESAMKYFLVQAIASIIFLLSILLMEKANYYSMLSYDYILSSALLMKMGAAPFHFWFPGVMEGLTWFNCFILMTWQKIAPFVLLSYKLYMSLMFNFIIIFSVIIGAIGGLNQSSIRKLMAYSSISHLGWMISAMMISNYYWMMYFLIYSFMNSSVIYVFYNQGLYNISQNYSNKNNSPLIKLSIFISMLSLGGLPPFLGFLPKWLIIQNMVESNYFLIILIMVMTTLITLYFYLRVMFSAFTFMNQEMNWSNFNFNDSLMSFMIAFSIFGIPIISCILN
uniref:NADH dehydrogenase subunit 2 n=1 Tax=Cordulegaster boltonii TaxID=126173 RepID=UPI002027B028|nr:NADH dehydrogenase subunit 2 [Cordulegaster boltonii]UPL65123.1 NADH dehydrogenase subunit 2 [Cordulegaster boltonii]